MITEPHSERSDHKTEHVRSNIVTAGEAAGMIQITDTKWRAARAEFVQLHTQNGAIYHRQTTGFVQVGQVKQSPPARLTVLRAV